MDGDGNSTDMTSERWREIEHIFQSAMEREPFARAAWVREASHGDDELRREVESLLTLNDDPVIVDEPAWQAAPALLDDDSDLSAGTEFGPYRIETLLGAGGMGRVYRARDMRLQRTVALKVCEAHFTQRFEREARAVAAINHPNICTLHDVGPDYLVMELVDGPTLAERIDRAPIAREEALAIARQLAAALDAAHEKGIVHRDLKPANIKITPDGVVKILDFGLAKWSDPGIDGANQGETVATVTNTNAGVILGTAAYMSPEQARGLPADKRTDIWAFGVVLFEMLTGAQPFQGAGATASEVISAVLTHSPDFSRVPPEMRHLVQACLEKDSKRRLRDIGDVSQLLEDGGSEPAVPLHKRTYIAVSAMLAVLAALTAFGWWRATERKDESPLFFDVDLGPKAPPPGNRRGSDVIVSSDGTEIVYVADGRLWTRRLSESSAKALPQTEGAFAPFFSADGQQVAFFTGARLKKISLRDGTVEIVCDPILGAGGAWGQDGAIIAAQNDGGLLRIAASGGPPTTLTQVTSVGSGGPSTHRWPQVLPGGKTVLFTAHVSPQAGFDDADIVAASLTDGRQTIVLHGGTYGRYVPTGHLLYVRRGSLYAVPFDVDGLEVRGTPTRVIERVAYSSLNGSAQVDVSRNGVLIYRRSGSGLVTVDWLLESGARQPLLSTPGEYLYPTISPDGQKLAMVVLRGANQEIWTYDWQRNLRSRLTQGELFNDTPCWTPNGRYLLFQGSGGMFWVRADGNGAPEVLTKSKTNSRQSPWSFAAGGKMLAYAEHYLDTRNSSDLWTVPLEDDGAQLHAGEPELFLRTAGIKVFPSFSPDGRWLAYASNESGTLQIYVISYPNKAHKVQISSDGGMYPMWSQRRNELFFRSLDNRIMVATYEIRGGSFVPQKARIWSEVRLAERVNANRNFDLAPDGTRVAALMSADPEDSEPRRNTVVFLLNFFDELRRRSHR